ncbi:unnamed protein product [Spirodela intermedia]|uniref:Rab-GAP TBC domain-containing protein n=1 Tax=Spirodela intermedia TaxID=51605 RepID=A0A7I8JM22_SPIIN|nr:unnamed protein product [Spirodela intermedia]CAA6671150.1 unnamed protein product [Spirodela intermedia]
MNLGILPSSPDASIEDIRRVAADSRRRYAILRRQLLMDPNFHKDGNRSPDLVMDNPLSQNPDSQWGRFFQNAELEKQVDQDLSRLYPEQGSYFQTQPCQAMLRRILLLWCLRHPGYGYKQGMHELMAPLIYVLYIDVQQLSQVRRLYEDQFNDEFDGRSFSESETMSKYGIRKSAVWDGETGEDGSQGAAGRGSSSDELDPETREIILLNDAYGTEGELGIILSERFMEHDAYCMFNALMNGADGVVAIADFFSPSPSPGSSSGLSPVIEASSALYHLLSAVDSPLHCHLTELEVEPQYFALRWLRVLFGREFSLQDLLAIWDEIFSSPNGTSHLIGEDEAQVNFRILSCPRGPLLSLSSLLATENTTTCLQRLLNFPENVNLRKLIDKARSLQDLAMDLNICSHLEPPLNGSARKNSAHVRRYSISSGSVSPGTPHYPVLDSYWEEKWRVLYRSEEQSQKGSNSDQKGILNGTSGRRGLTLLKTRSDISPLKAMARENESSPAVRRRLFGDSPPVIDLTKVEDGGLTDASSTEDHLPSTMANAEETCSSGENSASFSTATSPLSARDGHENDRRRPTSLQGRPPAMRRRWPNNRFQWFWKFGRGGGEGAAAENGNGEAADVGSGSSSSAGGGAASRVEVGDKRMMGTLKNLGQSMLENIQVGSLDNRSNNILGGKGQAAAMAALKELRKISQLLFEM